MAQVRWVVCFLLVLLPQAAQAGGKSEAMLNGGYRVELSSEEKPSGGYAVSIMYQRDGATLHAVESESSTAPHCQAYGDFPGKSYDTLACYTYSGGAHCCTTAYVFTVQGAAWWLSSMDYVEGELPDRVIPGEPFKRIEMLHGPQGQPVPEIWDVTDFQRLLVWDDAKGWRKDKVGENSAYYLERFQDASKDEQERGPGMREEYLEQYNPKDPFSPYSPDELQGIALQIVYNGHMAGLETEKLAKEYERIFPQTKKVYESYIPFAEILKAADTYNPVTFIHGQ